MRTHKWLYSSEENWNIDEALEWENSLYSDYHDTAEEIAEHLDNQAAEYPDKREFWLMNEEHDTPQKMVVRSEFVTTYSARISNETP
jgi:hypothetical protein